MYQTVPTNGDLERLSERDGPRCFYCGRHFAPSGDLAERNSVPTVEHFVPRSKGGPDILANKVLACGRCNSEVGDKSIVEKVAYRDAQRAR